MRACLAALLSLVLSLVSWVAFAQEWPARPVTMIVPYAAGGPVDIVGRIMAAALSETLGQQVIVENVPGAGGMTGANRVARAAPDGYTFLLGGSATMTLVPAIYGAKTLYSPLADFEHVNQFADSARILIVRKDMPANTLADFAAYARTNKDNVRFGTSGAGSGMHVCALLLDQAIGTKSTHVPYRGSAPAMQDLHAGRIDFICEQISSAVQQIRAGNVKGIATLGLSRASALPDIATAQEQGLGDLDCPSWSAFSFPKRTPEAIVRKLLEATNKAVETAFVRERLDAVGVAIIPAERRTHEHLMKILPAEMAKQAEVVKAGGLTAE